MTDAISQPITTKPCPQCGATMPVYREFSTWCDQCDWGLEPQTPQEKQNRLNQLFDRLGKSQSQSLFAFFSKDMALRPTWSKSRILAFSLAGAVHLLTILLVIGSIPLLLAAREAPPLALIALLMLAMAWLLHPQPISDPKENRLTRAEAPQIYRLADEVAKALNTRIDQIAISASYNASFSKTSWAQRHTLCLGLPYWLELNNKERVALLGHELAHAVNGDATRSLFIGTAIDALVKWYQMIVPEHIIEPGGNLVSLLGAPFRLVALGVAQLVWWLIHFLFILLYRDMQRAEYLADRLAAQVGGTQAVVDLLRKTYLSETFDLAVQHCALDASKQDVYQEMRHLVDCTPARELERRHRLEKKTMQRIDVTHPPTGMRIDLLSQHPITSPAVTVSDEQMTAINSELDNFKPKIQRKLVEAYQAAIS